MLLTKFRNEKDMMNIEKEFRKLADSILPFRILDREMDVYENSIWAPLADIVESNDKFIINMDIPGVRKEDIKIQISNGKLSISGERKSETETKENNYHRIERSFGKYYRSFDLPEIVKTEDIKADLKDGQLTITLPKAEKVLPKEIPISVS